MEKTIKIIWIALFGFWFNTQAFALTVAPIRSLDEAVYLSDEIVLGRIIGSNLNQGTRGVSFRTYGIQVEKCLKKKTPICPKQTYFKQPDANKMGIPGLPVWREGSRGIFFLWKNVITGVYTVFTLDEKKKTVTGPLNGKLVTYALTDFEKRIAQAKPYEIPKPATRQQPKKTPPPKKAPKNKTEKPGPSQLKTPTSDILK